MRLPDGFYIDDPAFPLVLTHISFWDVTSAAGNALGTTLVCANLANEPSYEGLFVKPLDGDAAGQVRQIALHAPGTTTVGVTNAFTDNAGAVVQIIAGTRFVIMATGPGGGGAPSQIVRVTGAPAVDEFWQTEAVDLNIWTPTHPATNPLVVVTDAAPYNALAAVEFDVEDAEWGRLIGRANVNRWRVMPNLISEQYILKRLVMEWEIYHNDVANQNQAASFMGLVTNVASTRVTNDMIGFGYVANLLSCVTDNGGVEEVTATTPVIEDNMRKLKIVVIEGGAFFYIDDTLVGSHVVAASLPDQYMYPMWYFISAGGGADAFECYLPGVSIRYEAVM